MHNGSFLQRSENVVGVSSLNFLALDWPLLTCCIPFPDQWYLLFHFSSLQALVVISLHTFIHIFRSVSIDFAYTQGCYRIALKYHVLYYFADAKMNSTLKLVTM